MPGNFVMKRHAYERSDGRSVYREDIQSVGYTAYDCEHQGGCNLRFMDLTAMEILWRFAVYDGETVVITVI